MYKGTSASIGIGIDKAAIIKEMEMVIKSDRVADGQAEVERLRGALNEMLAQTERMAAELAEKVGEKEAEIMQGHLMLLTDLMLIGEIENATTGESVCSGYAIETVCNTYADMFASMDDGLIQQRATNMKDIKTRMQQSPLGIKMVGITSPPESSAIVARDSTLPMTAGISPAHIIGIVTELDGKTSHSAILARALEIPAVVVVAGILDEIGDGNKLVLDGSEGTVTVKPDAAVMMEYTGKREVFLKGKKELEQYIDKPTITKDDVSVELVANIGKPEDVEKAFQYDGEGVGLFRTEFLLMDRNLMPAENEQFEAHKKVVEALKSKPVIIRTLDIGGDKEIPYLDLAKDENPSLGYRTIQFCLDRREDVYKPQLRALPHASAFGNIKITISLVTCIDECREAKALTEELKAELDSQGVAYNKGIQAGIMVEMTTASLIADILAKEVDFFSIGASDLTRYTMSVDRGNDKVSYLYSTFNPAMPRSTKRITSCVREVGIMVGMCGEAASDPVMIPLLLASGLNELSMSASIILKARKMITSHSASELQAVADEAMSFTITREVEDYIRALINR